MSETILSSEQNYLLTIEKPPEWRVVKFADISELITKGATPTTYGHEFVDSGIPFLRGVNASTNGELKLDDIKYISLKADQLISRSRLHYEDILLSIVGTMGIFIFVPKSILTANINQNVALIRLRKDIISPSYAKYFLQSKAFSSQISIENTLQAQASLSLEQVGQFKIILPLPIEQQSIAETLDAIDKAIALTDTHIIKLKKAKAGLLHDLLTRGIDDHGELRDYTRNPELFKRSALGIIPKDWEVESLESVCSNIVDCPHTTPIFRDEGVLIARTFNIRDGIFNISEVSYISEEDYTQRISRLKPQLGDVIFTREAPVGEAFVIPEGMRVCLGQRTMLLRPNPDKAIGDYIVAQVYSEIIKTRINQITGGTTNPYLNVADVRTFRVPFPKVYEQRRITDALKKQDLHIQQKAKLREKLKLLKKGLMSDLLSGRVRVKI
ncbi:restriction endonuclease subunit S [Nostoc sp.]|uniref:restriction endonuclease subunit S n=1 Tax=Nostoc sp. TaxID=1180 RepID=UPI002FF60450